MIEIPLPDMIKVGGFDYEIIFDAEESKRLAGRGNYGEQNHSLKSIWVDDGLDPQQLMSTTLHELIHAIDYVYCCGIMDDKTVSGIAHGLLQVFEQLGIRFVVKKS